MDQQYQPLFNRTYLKILPWIVAIVIVILTARNQDSRSETYETLEENWIYLSIDEELQQEQLKLVYPLHPAFSEPQVQQRIALQASIGQALRAEKDITTQWHDDKLVLNIHLPRENSEDSFSLKALLDKITHAVSLHYPQALQHAGAERYLALNTLDELALSNLKGQLLTPSMQVTANNASYLFSNRPTVLLLLTEENDSFSQAISDQLKTLYPFTAEETTAATPLTAPAYISLKHRGSSFLYMIGHVIPADNNNVSRSVAFHYINQTLKEVANNTLSHYRLLLRPSAPVGYAALSMTQNSPFRENVSNNLQTYLLKNLNNDKLEEIKSVLATQYSEQLADAETRANMLAIHLFSAEKLQSNDEFHDTLASISTQQIQAYIEALFNPEHAIIVKISPP